MPHEVVRDVEATVTLLQETYQQGGINEDLYYKGLMELVHEYVIHDLWRDAVGLMLLISRRYLDSVLMYQVYLDPKFGEKVFKIREVYLNHGIYLDMRKKGLG